MPLSVFQLSSRIVLAGLQSLAHAALIRLGRRCGQDTLPTQGRVRREVPGVFARHAPFACVAGDTTPVRLPVALFPNPSFDVLPCPLLLTHGACTGLGALPTDVRVCFEVPRSLFFVTGTACLTGNASSLCPITIVPHPGSKILLELRLPADRANT